MTVFYYTDETQIGDPFLFVIETASILEANKAFKEQTGYDYMSPHLGVTCELVFDQILEIPGEEREQPHTKYCKHNQDTRYACGACRNEKEGKKCRHGVKAGIICGQCIIER